MTDQVYRRRRETDRAEQRAERAADRGDHAGYLLAMGQAEAARRRRAEWASQPSVADWPPEVDRPAQDT